MIIRWTIQCHQEHWFVVFLRWILRLCGNDNESVEAPSIDLQQKAENIFRKKLKHIKYRSIDEVDSNPRYTPESAIIGPPESTDPFIEFHHDMIQSYPEMIFRGTILGQRNVAVKKIGSDHLRRKEMETVRKLAFHENILTHFFWLKQDINYMVMEFYSCTLLDYNSFDLRDVVAQLCSGLEFLHDARIVQCRLQLSNIAVTMQADKTIYKITNFRDSITDTYYDDDFKRDVKGLGVMLLNLRQRLENMLSIKGDIEDDFNKWSTHDNLLCVDLIDKMTQEHFHDRPTIKEVKCHPLLWTPKEILHFIVQVAKLLETNDPNFVAIIAERSNKIFNVDWRRYICRMVRNELDEIKRSKLPYHLRIRLDANSCSLRSDIFALIKTIRNLVVHHNTNTIEQAMGPTDERLLCYWTNRFPQLILELYNARELYQQDKDRFGS